MRALPLRSITSTGLAGEKREATLAIVVSFNPLLAQEKVRVDELLPPVGLHVHGDRRLEATAGH